MTGIRAVFNKSNIDIELLTEYMDTKIHKPKILFPALQEIYAVKYHKMQPDIIISTDNNALEFLLSNRELLFPGVPIVFCGINNYSDSLIENQVNMTGVVEDIDIEGTIDLALHLHPEISKIVVISDTTHTSIVNLERIKQSFPKFTNRVSFVELTGLAAQELKTALNHLSDNSLVIHNGLYRDGKGRNFTIEEGLDFVVQNTRAPVYTLWQFMINKGVLGGVVVNGFSQGEQAALAAEKILQGESLDHMSVLKTSPNVPMFDYNVMSRFGINRSDLPKGSIVFNIPSSFYTDHKNVVWTTIVSISTLIFILFILIFNINTKEKVEKELRIYQDHLENLVKERTAELEKDIIVRKRAEEMLRIERDNLNNIFEAMEDGVYIVNQQYDIQYVNSVLIKDYGIYKGKKCYEYFHDRKEACSWCKNPEVFLGKTVRWEWYSPKSHRTYDLIDTPLKNPDNSISKLEIFRDVTKRKQTEEILKESEKRYHALADASFEAIFITENGYCIDANKAAEKMFGFDHDELIGLCATDIIAPESLQEVLRNMLSGYSEPYEVITQKKDGTKFYSEVRGRTIQDNDRKVRVTVVHDINEKKLYEKVLLKAHDKLEIRVEERTFELSKANKQLEDTTNTLNNVLSSSTEYAIIATDLSFRIFLNNPAAERIFGYTTKEMIGRTVPEIHIKEKVEPEPFNHAISQVRKYDIYEYDTISKNSTGKKYFIHNIIMPMKNEQNNTTGYILFSQDVTKIKHLQDRLVRSERLAATGKLAATIAHEINSPLQGIVTLISFLKEAYAEDKKLNEDLEIIKNGFESIKNTINKLMNLSRPAKEEKQPVHINSIINDTISLVQFQMDKFGIKSNINMASEIPTIYASPSQLGHVFLNLINNAIEAMTEQIPNKEISIKSTIEENNIMITIHDTGPGVDKKDMAHIFDPFYSKKKTMGLGVGLSVCNSYIEDHNGSISVENHPSGGALFTIVLPAGEKI